VFAASLSHLAAVTRREKRRDERRRDKKNKHGKARTENLKE
jgi:hypothetical protein